MIQQTKTPADANRPRSPALVSRLHSPRRKLYPPVR
jgi:hypothetical protein